MEFLFWILYVLFSIMIKHFQHFMQIKPFKFNVLHIFIFSIFSYMISIMKVLLNKLILDDFLSIILKNYDLNNEGFII